MGVKVENFEFSPNVMDLTEGEFKALLKKKFGTTAKRAKEIYKKIHGNDTTVPEEASEDIES
jgi:hypothetical protein